MVEQEPQPTPEGAMGEQGDPWAANRARMHEDQIRNLSDPPSGVEAYPIDSERLALIEAARKADAEVVKKHAENPDAPLTILEWAVISREKEAERLRAGRERVARGASDMYSPVSD